MIEQDVAEVPVAIPNPRMSDIDVKSLEIAKLNRKLALANAETALAKNESSELAYKHLVLQIYVKYGLNENDAITESGEIIKNGAVQKQGS